MGLKRYYFTNILKLLFLQASFILLINATHAQNYRNPYSYYGIGELQEKTFIANNCLSGLSIGWYDLSSYSPMNPASYSNMFTSTFDIGMKGKIQHLEQNNNSYTSNIISFSYFSLGFPIKKKIKWAAAFGLLPVSSIGYKNSNTTSYNDIDTFDKIETFENSGGFSQAYLGTSVQLFKKLNIGANLSYLFGNTNDLHKQEFTGNTKYINILESNLRSYGNLYSEFGVQYIHTIKGNEKEKVKGNEKDRFLTIGAVFSPGTKLPAYSKRIVQTFLNYSGTYYYRDSIINTETKSGELFIPAKTGIGLTYSLPGKYKLGLDYRFEQWSAFKDFYGSNQNLKNMHIVALGSELTPERNSISYFKRITYRAGAKYTSSYLNFGDGALKVISGSLGFGFPITNKFNKQIINQINIGMNAGKYLNVPKDGIKESFINLYFGVRFNDFWFIQPKID